MVRAGLADRDAARLAVGDSAAVTFGALPGETRRGRIARIGAAASPGAGTYEVEIALREPVRIAYLDGDRAAIAAGLEGVTRVVADGAAYLSAGSRVRESVR